MCAKIFCAFARLCNCYSNFTFFIGFGVLHWSPTAPCTVLVGNEASEVTAAKSTNTDLSKLHNSSLRSKTGQTITVTAASAASSDQIYSASQPQSSATLSSSSSASATSQLSAAASPSSAFQSTSASSIASVASASAPSSPQSDSSFLTKYGGVKTPAGGGNYSQVLIIFK